jgi:hypothetical protein
MTSPQLKLRLNIDTPVHPQQKLPSSRYQKYTESPSEASNAFVKRGKKEKELSAAAKPFIPAGLLSPEAQPFNPQPQVPESSKAEENLYNPYDKLAPKAFRKGMDAIYGLSFGGSLAFVFDGHKNQTVWTPAGNGPAKIQVSISEKLQIEVISGGLCDGDCAQILINGKNYSPNERGVNILVVDPNSLDAYVGVFDTHTHIGNESSHLARFISAIPEKNIVLIAVRYDATRRMHQEARRALQQKGVSFPSIDNVESLSEVIGEINPSLGAELLSMAATVNAWKCADLLLEKGWNVNYQKKHGSRNTPLLDAVFHGSVAVVEVLLKYGANQTLQNKWHETAKDIVTKLFGFETPEQMVEHLKKIQATALVPPTPKP